MTELQTLGASVPPSKAVLERMQATIDELESVIAERDQELQAARRRNADRTRELNPILLPPEPIESRMAEIRSTISSLDDTSLADMSDFYYMHGFNELNLAGRDLLKIIEPLQK